MTEDKKAITAIRETEIVELIRVREVMGAGVEGDPCRIVEHYYQKDGLHVVSLDPSENGDAP